MPATKSSASICPSLPNVVPTNADTESPVTPDYGREDAVREAWQKLIDHRLIEWGRNPSQIEDEGIEPPTGQTIRLAIELAQALRDAGSPPHSVVPDPNGGIVFERREKDVSEVFHVWDDGTVEYCGFQGARLVERWAL